MRDLTRDGTRSKPGTAARDFLNRLQRLAERADGDCADLDLLLAELPTTDLGNIERFVIRNRGRLAWDAKLGWLFQNGGAWCRDVDGCRLIEAERQCARAIQSEAAALASSKADKIVDVINPGRRDAQLLRQSDILRAWGRLSEFEGRLRAMSSGATAYLSTERPPR